MIERIALLAGQVESSLGCTIKRRMAVPVNNAVALAGAFRSKKSQQACWIDANVRYFGLTSRKRTFRNPPLSVIGYAEKCGAAQPPRWIVSPAYRLRQS